VSSTSFHANGRAALTLAMLLGFGATGALAASSSAELARLLAGPLTPETLKDVVHLHHAEVRACALARSAEKQKVRGRVIVHFTIEPKGTLKDVRKASSTVNELSLESCLVSAVRTWKFPKPKHGLVEVNFPFTVGPPAPSNAPAAEKPPVAEDEDLVE
jgi:TonB family protein